jgi:hypothetical protein
MWEPLSGKEEEDSDNGNTNINKQQNNKGKEAKGRYVLCIYAFLLSEFCFVVGTFFYDLVKLRNFFITKNLVLVFKLSTRESFYYTKRDFTVIFVF